MMNNSVGYSQNVTVIKDEPCSEKKCATCFAHRGCMYEQYAVAPAFNLLAFYLENQVQKQKQSITR